MDDFIQQVFKPRKFWVILLITFILLVSFKFFTGGGKSETSTNGLEEVCYGIQTSLPTTTEVE